MGYWLLIVMLIHDSGFFIIHCSLTRTALVVGPSSTGTDEGYVSTTPLKKGATHTSSVSLEQAQTAHKEYTKLSTHVRNLSGTQWITKCNNTSTQQRYE